jgi:hypothetical protein
LKRPASDPLEACYDNKIMAKGETFGGGGKELNAKFPPTAVTESLFVVGVAKPEIETPYFFDDQFID